MEKRRVVPAAVLTFLLFVSLCASTAIAAIVRVSPRAAGPTHDGLTWQTAYPTVQQGVDAASAGDSVWVSNGTYLENVSLKNGVALYGGFFDNATAFSQRNPAVFLTVLDGNRVRSVVTIASCPSTLTRIDGFTIRNGTGTPTSSYGTPGGGIHCTNASPTITNNLIAGNTATFGGGIYCSGSYPVISGNTFTGNGASGSGGGIASYYGSAVISRNSFDNNNAVYVGSALMCVGSTDNINNNIIAFNNNYAIYLDSHANVSITNNTIAYNSSYGEPALDINNSSPVVKNNIFADYPGTQCISNLTSTGSRPLFGFNDVSGCSYYGPAVAGYVGFPDVGDFSADPLFVDGPGGDFRLKAGSACVDAGDNSVVATDNAGKPLYPTIYGEPRIQKGYALAVNATVDVGADELDTRSPATSCIVSGTNGVNGWYRMPPTVTLSATDSWIDNTIPAASPGSGVAYTEYSWDTVTWVRYTAPFSYSREGENTLYYRSVDTAGNVEPVKTRLVRIDMTLPQPSITLAGTAGDNGWYRSSVTVTLSATDTVSGVFSIQYSFDNVAWSTYSAPFVYSAQGQGTIYCRAWDYAQNSAVVSRAIKIDIASPSMVSTDPANMATAVSRSKVMAVTFNENIATGTGVGGITVTYVNNKKQTVAVARTASVSATNPASLEIRPASTLNASTKYTVTVPAGAVKDLAGNPSAAATSFFFTTGSK